jgi:hypothetical protein
MAQPTDQLAKTYDKIMKIFRKYKTRLDMLDEVDEDGNLLEDQPFKNEMMNLVNKVIIMPAAGLEKQQKWTNFLVLILEHMQTIMSDFLPSDDLKTLLSSQSHISTINSSLLQQRSEENSQMNSSQESQRNA